MTKTIRITNVRLCSDDTGYFSRHDELTADGEVFNAACDNPLDASNEDAAIDEIVDYFGGKVSRDEIIVIR